MTGLPFRPFLDDAAVRVVGEGLLARTLPRPAWTHEAHLAALLWLLRETDVDVDARIADIIRDYNAAVGGVNDDRQGYHDTITRCFVAGGRLHLATGRGDEPLVESANSLLASPIGQRRLAAALLQRSAAVLGDGAARVRGTRPRAVARGVIASMASVQPRRER